MFNSATKDNRVVTTALTITYKTERCYETLPDGTLRYWWKVTRSASKDYRYVDMTEKAAILAAAMKVELYTRQTRKNISRTLDKVCPSLTTSVQPEFNACGSWNVVINVNETDSTHSDTLPADPAALFTEENARDYDEGEGGGELNLLFLDIYTSQVEVTLDDQQFRDNVLVQYKENPDSTEWHTLPTEYIHSIIRMSVPGETPSTWSLNYENPSPLVPDQIARIKCGNAVSNEVIIGNGE